MRHLLLLALFVAGCAEQPASAPGNDVVDVGPFTPYGAGDDDTGEVLQGRYLLGTIADGLALGDWHFSVGGTGVKGAVTALVTVDGARLVASDALGNPYTDAQFVGVRFTNATRELKIVGVEEIAPGVPRYQLQYRPIGGVWTNYCDTKTNHAVPFQGRWNLRRYHIDGPELSFGCVDEGVSAKCVAWGYPPGDDGTSADWLNHRSCVTMANAILCDNGVPHTRELTPIMIRDFVPGAQPDATLTATLPILVPTDATWPPADEFFFEAAWQAYGPPICLSRLRWASLSTGGRCSVELPDPRAGVEGAEFCEDLTVADLRARGARHFSGVKPMDLIMRRWRNPATGDLVTTVAGYVDDTTEILPFPGYTDHEGADAILLRALTGGLEDSDVVEVFLQHNAVTGDHVVAPADAPGVGTAAGYVLLESEGYLLTAEASGSVPFGLWVHANGTDYVTSMESPDLATYTLVKWLGHAIAP